MHWPWLVLVVQLTLTMDIPCWTWFLKIARSLWGVNYPYRSWPTHNGQLTSVICFLCHLWTVHMGKLTSSMACLNCFWTAYNGYQMSHVDTRISFGMQSMVIRCRMWVATIAHSLHTIVCLCQTGLQNIFLRVTHLSLNFKRGLQTSSKVSHIRIKTSGMAY